MLAQIDLCPNSNITSRAVSPSTASLLVTVPVGLVEASQPDNVTIPPGYTITRVNLLFH
jgi:hypothetical protein